MALMLQTISANKNPSTSNLLLSPTHFLKSPKFYFSPSNSRTHFLNCRFLTSQRRLFTATKVNASFEEPYGASQNQVSGNSSSSFDAFLSAVEFLSFASSAAVSVYIAVRCGVQKGGALGLLGSKILVWQCVVLVGGLVAGAVIRRRQWRRICGVGISRGSASSGANLLERVEKLEDDLRSSATIIQALSRRLGKLGIRFRLTRKALKEPIAESVTADFTIVFYQVWLWVCVETAALVQKNSEATRALVAQEDILEKELGEIQKVLLAMQHALIWFTAQVFDTSLESNITSFWKFGITQKVEQQQKQLELILAIGKAGKLLETKRVKSRDQKAPETSESSVDGVANLEISQIENLARRKEANNDRP
ncbi:UNVERIFIED_CONTAM: hypothetical protein Slati_1487500 [Sesamum latifolium]|uniref:Uncharacterized protein n=1 Tax=Sesamum latifolium TaxID=2727402 RepID=A0AAW2X8Q7_9LAMI